MATYDGRVADEAFITLATNDVYARGALVLAESLKKYKTMRQLVVMITPHVSSNARSALENVFDVVRLVDVLDSRDATHLALLKRPELGITFTKIHCWTFTEYKKCVFMDADMMALQNIDDLFERDEMSAAPDSGWPDIFNSGLFVFCPSFDTFHSLLVLAENEGSFDGGDQGLLNTYFSNWSRSDISRHLPFLYNLHVSASYQYLPAFKRFGKDTKVVHFLGPVKPWHHVYNRVSGNVEQVPGTSQSGVRHFPEFLKEWWAIYNDKVQSYFSQEQEMKDGRRFIEERKPPTDDEITHVDDAGHQHSETPEQEHHEDHQCHEHSEPPPNPYNWELPASFFKTQPIYVEEPPPPPPEPHPVIHITPPSTVMLNTQSEPHVELGMTPADVEKVSTTNVRIQEVCETPTSKLAVLHGDPNIITRAPEYEIVPAEGVTPKAGRDEEPQGHMSTQVDSDWESCDSAVASTTGLSTPSSVEFDALMSADYDVNFDIVAQDATSPDRSLTPPQSPTELMTKTPETVENIQLAKIEHMEAWQRGDADYMGRDKFANIQAALDAFLS